MIGQKISHYRVLEKLGDGGMGVVYKAKDTKLGRLVALKFLAEDIARDETAVERFKREARTASALDHPNICTIYEISEHDGQPFIAMQYLEGETLKQRIGAQRALSGEEVARLGLQAAEALEAAHAKGIVHRDIKPANIFLAARGQAVMLDFGLAKLVEPAGGITAADSLTQTGVAPGTLPYMAPEQLRGQEVDARTDLYALGCVLYEMATGQRPFRAESKSPWKGIWIFGARWAYRTTSPSAFSRSAFVSMWLRPRQRPSSWAACARRRSNTVLSSRR